MKILKILVLTILLCAITAPVFAATDKTLISGPIESSGYGGPFLRGTEINGNFGMLVGGYGGWYINHCFLIGGGGCGLVGDIIAPISSPGPDALHVNLGYGGLVLEAVDHSHEILHLTLSTLIGAGGVEYSSGLGEGTPNPDYQSAFFVAEPAVNMELNVSGFFRIDFGASYRYIKGVKLVGITDKDLSGSTVFLAFKFGAF